MQLYGTVIHGQGRGADLGFPTANIQLSSRQSPPEAGVYAGFARVDDTKESVPHLAAIHVGPKPTFAEQDPTIEAHLLDFTGNLYNKTLYLDIRHKLRDVKKFDTLEALRSAIKHDCERTRDLLAH